MSQIVHPAQIESELDRIWDSLQGANKMRACLFNLIFYAQKSQRTNYLTKIAQQVIEKFPSRVIFVTYDENGSGYDLKTSVSVLTADQGENEIVCDLIEVEACKGNQQRIPFVILPHILPDLPVYLVHADDPSLENPISGKLEHFADRIIFDSESSDNLQKFAQAALTHYEKSQADIADLNWARTEGLRQLFANVFKSDQELNWLKSATTIHIDYNCHETDYLCHTPIQAIYLQAWIACQLEWTLKKVEKEKDICSFTYEKESFPVRVFLRPKKREDIPPGRIISIEIETDKEERYVFSRSLTCSHHMSIEKSSPELCSVPIHFVLERDVSGQSLVKEICHRGTSTHYMRVLSLLAQTNELGLCK